MKQSVLYLLICGLLLPCQRSVAESVWEQTTIVGGFELGHKSQQLGELLDSRLNFYTLYGNLQATYKDYYVGLNLSDSLGKTDITEDGEVGSADRSDIDIVFGWYPNKNVTVFAGYKHGKTILDLITREDEGSSDPQIPFQNILYIGDGLTDVPCMTVIRNNGGYAIAVFKPGDSRGQKICKELLRAGRVDFIAEADYRNKKELDRLVKLLLDNIVEGIRYGRESFNQSQKYLS